ncbi:MAG: hypothetical protein AAFR38_09135 [Planctomycetota bacterium]
MSNRGTPLFELVGQAKKAEQPRLADDSPPQRRSEEVHADREAAPGRGSTVWYLLIAGALGIGFVGYSIGYQVGLNAASAPPDVAAGGTLETESSPSGRTGEERAGPTGDTAVLGQRQPETGEGGAGGDFDAGWAIYTVRGGIDDDPRQTGMNYLALATLPREDAIAAIRYLASRGVQAVAVTPEVDPSGRPAKSSARYVVHSLKVAIPGNQFSQSRARREAHEREVGEIGREWLSEGGASNFSATGWSAFRG